MKIRLAHTAGFCMGVRRAVDMVLDLQRQDVAPPVVTYGPLIHNPQTLELLHSRGIREVRVLDEISEGAVVVRAHGISPAERDALARKGVVIIDATCPRVAGVQAVIKKHASKGRFCIIVGDEDHPEVRGLLGFASAGGAAAPTPAGLPTDIPMDQGICVVAQTTQDAETFETVVAELKKTRPDVHVYNTICDSTKRRQEEVARLARQVEFIIVVGGKGSGNTQRLLKIAEAKGVRAAHVETEEELDPAMLAGVHTVGVTAGASTPNWLIRRVIEKVKEIGMSRAWEPWVRVRRVLDVFIMTYGTAAAGGAGLTVMCTALQGAPAGWKAPLATALFVFSMHLLNRMHERAGAVRFNTPEIALFYARRRGLLTAAGIAALIGAGYVAFLLGTVAGATLSALMFTGRMYAVPLPFPGLKRRCLKDIPGSKTPLVAAGWALSAAALPALGAWDTVGGGAALAFILAAGMVFWRTALSDLIDIQGDRIVGRETIPILVGAARTTKALNVMPACMAILVILWGLAGGSPAACIAALACLGLFAVCFRVYARRRIVDRLLFEGLLDAIFVLAGLLTIALGKNGL